MKPLHVVGSILDDFRKLQRSLERNGEYVQFYHDFERWKRRSISQLERTVSQIDLDKFRELRTKFDWGNPDEAEFELLIDEHDAYLVSLYNDMQSHPEFYREKEAKLRSAEAMEQRPISQELAKAPTLDVAAAITPVRATPLTMPEEITLGWLVEHVPFRFWVFLAGLLAGAVVLGVRLTGVLGPLLGIDPQ